MGLPKAICGNFAGVYQFQCANRSIGGEVLLAQRLQSAPACYGNLSTFTEFNHVSTLLEFEYLLKGILVNGSWFPHRKSAVSGRRSDALRSIRAQEHAQSPAPGSFPFTVYRIWF